MRGEIIQLDVLLLGIALPKPFPLGFGTLSSLPRVLLKLTAQKGETMVVGVGEASIDFPFTTYDAWDIYWALSQLEFGKGGYTVDNREQLLQDAGLRAKLLDRFPAAFAALNMALDDLYGRFYGVSALELYGVQRTEGQPVISLPFYSGSTELLPAIDLVLARGAVVKPKVGQGFEHDLATILAVGEHLQRSGSRCILDFNAHYSVEECLRLIGALAHVGFPWETVLVLEQPTRKLDGISGLAEVHQYLDGLGLGTYVMADEVFVSVGDGLACHRAGILLNHKIHKIGGILVAREVEALLGATAQPSMVGGTFPTAIGRAWDQQAAAVLHTASLPSDGWQPSTDWFRGDKHFIAESFPQTSAGWSTPFNGSGLGITVDWARVERFVILDPKAEYRRVRYGLDGEKISVVLRDGASYAQVYEQTSGRSVDWNL